MATRLPCLLARRLRAMEKLPVPLGRGPDRIDELDLEHDESLERLHELRVGERLLVMARRRTAPPYGMSAPFQPSAGSERLHGSVTGHLVDTFTSDEPPWRHPDRRLGVWDLRHGSSSGR